MKRKSLFVLLLTGLLCNSMVSCNNSSQQEGGEASDSDFASLGLEKENYVDTVDGKATDLFLIKNAEGMTAAFTNYGGRIVGLWVPDKDGQMTDVVIGLGSVKAYEESTEPYFGATIGRYGNRIAKGTFSLDGEEYHLPINNGPNTLHGGGHGFESEVFDAKKENDSTLTFSLLSEDGDQGFPGNLKVTVTYSLTSDNGLKMDYDAETDRKTVINLTNHAFFNLNGEGSGTILNHLVKINSDEFLPVDSTLIPFGKPEQVAGTPYDFNTFKTIGKEIDEDNEQLKNANGYDQNFILKEGDKEHGLNHAATVIGDKSGIQMDIYTQEPGLQFYSGNFMEAKNTLKTGHTDDFRTAFAMETQHYPDSPNEPDYPSTELKPGEKYHTESLYRFSVEKN